MIMHGLLTLAFALVLAQPAPPPAPLPPPVVPPPVAPPTVEPLPVLTEQRLLAIERKVETIQKEYADNAILREERLGPAIEQADRQEGRPVELYARVIRVDEQRVHIRFFKDLIDLKGPLIELVDKPGGAYLGGTRQSPALVVGSPSLPLELARTLRKDDLLRIRGALASIELAPRYQVPQGEESEHERAVRIVIVAPRIEKIEEAPQPVAPAPVPPRVAPPLPLPLPIPPLPPPSVR
jgi:hypothetical protein